MSQKIAESIEESMVPLPAPIPNGLVCPTPAALLVQGGVASGKTQTLIEHATHLLETGTKPGDIVVFCATPTAAVQFKERLSAASRAAHNVEVTTPRAWCLAALEDPEVQAATGRSARLLAPFEVDLLMEDVKTGGVRPQRLRQMLRFFYKSLTELCDWDAEWLLTGEEKLTYGLLQECLRFTGGILEPELANTLARHLHNNPKARARLGRPHVLADDYQMLSRASQVLASELATEGIAVAADPALSVEVFESYPYANGVAEFCTANPQAELCTLETGFACKTAVRAANAIALSASFGTAPLTCTRDTNDELVTLHAATPEEECAQVVDAVTQALREGTEPRHVSIVAPNTTWERTIRSALVKRSINACSILQPKATSGDPRDLERCQTSRILTALYLVADPHDGVAWRSWVGFGDYFTCSLALTSIRLLAAPLGMPIADALTAYAQQARSAGENRAQHAHIEAALNSARSLIEGAVSKEGDELLGYLSAFVTETQDAEVPALLRRLTAPLPDGAHPGTSAAAMAARARVRLACPGIEDADAVQVVTLGNVTGLTPDMLVLCGFVNGFFPSRGVIDRELLVQEDADKQMAKDLRYLANAAGKPLRTLAVSYFDEMGLEPAERLKMKIGRVQLHDGRRVAKAQPSAYLPRLID